jgi:3-dehydroquinate synthase
LRQLRVRTKAHRHEYEIVIGRGILSETGGRTRACLGDQAPRIVLISNLKVFSLYGATVMQSLNASGFSVWPMLMGDGERYKSLRTAENIVNFLSEAELERTDGVVALGGGVVGDVAGFAAAVYLRGVPFIQIPTTLLAQIDSSVGGKTGVNLPRGKNLVGSFHQPSTVIIDIGTLATLPRRELTAGWCECVKQGAVASRKLFKQTTDCLTAINDQDGMFPAGLEKLIASHCAFKASIVAGDEREGAGRRDRGSRRILNFGHTIGHALEAVTNYRRFRHGEAVGHGMLVAGELSKNLGLLDQSELELLRQAVRSCGSLPSAKNIDQGALLNAIRRDKKRARGHVQWVLLEGIGKPRIVDGKEISQAIIKRSVREVFRG